MKPIIDYNSFPTHTSSILNLFESLRSLFFRSVCLGLSFFRIFPTLIHTHLHTHPFSLTRTFEQTHSHTHAHSHFCTNTHTRTHTRTPTHPFLRFTSCVRSTVTKLMPRVWLEKLSPGKNHSKLKHFNKKFVFCSNGKRRVLDWRVHSSKGKLSMQLNFIWS